MRKARMTMLLAALASPVTVAAKAPIDAAGLKAIEAKVPRQSWYPEGYYDVRIAADGQMADFPRDTLTMDWGDGQRPYYDVIDCNAEYVSLDETDPLTARYGGVALEVARLRAEFERMKYPVAVYAEPLLAFEKAMIEDAKAEGNNEAARIFHYAKEAEKVHARLYDEALANLGNEPEGQDYYLCPICGYIHKGKESTSPCPICGAKPSIFKKF